MNLREGKEKVSDFMQKKSWTFPVLMDNGDVAQKYQVRGIPHSVLIDKTGKIRFVHIGFGGAEKLEAQLRKEFDQLLA